MYMMLSIVSISRLAYSLTGINLNFPYQVDEEEDFDEESVDDGMQ